MKIDYPLLIDGGLSNELEKQGCDLNNKLWSALMLEENPEAIINAHLSYLLTGAQCITTASYQASIAGFASIGFAKAKAEMLILKSVQLAEEAIKRYKSNGLKGPEPLIAASIGPYGAYLADGSEYHGNYFISDKELTDYHFSRISILDASKADLLACETIPSFQEGKVLANILATTKKSSWLSFSCKDEYHINDGTPIKDCVSLLKNNSKIFAIGINCTAPQYISGLIKSIKSVSETIGIVVYPNSGEAYNAQSKTWVGISDPVLFNQMAKEWIELGANIIGGCCRIGPEHIKCLSEIIVRN